MSLLSRLFGKRQDDPYTSGVALYEEGRFDDAIELLREAIGGRENSPSASLANFHLRGALVASGRRKLRAGEAAQALPMLEEAASSWDAFPDLQFLAGAARCLTNDLEGALSAAGKALRKNADYCEARLLEACVLVELGRRNEAADSLNKLLESGRRVDCLLLNHLHREGGYKAADLPQDLKTLLVQCAGGDTLESEVAATVALCRSGRWDEGREKMQRLVESRPDYPDLHLKLAGIHYQIASGDEAMAEVEEALRLKPAYRSALHLQALILAERQDFVAAARALHAAEASDGSPARAHEELFATYLGAVLDLLTGRPEGMLKRLGAWGDLTRDFPYAELLMAAADELVGNRERSLERLGKLVKAWPGDSEYLYFLICQLLLRGELAKAERMLAGWPAGSGENVGDRPLRLNAELALLRADIPRFSVSDAKDRSVAWRFLDVRCLALQKKWADSFEAAETLWREGFAVEAVAREMAAAAVMSPFEPPASDWAQPQVVATATVPDVLAFLRLQGRGAEADGLLARHGAVSPDYPLWKWLNPAYWLEPVRQWIA